MGERMTLDMETAAQMAGLSHRLSINDIIAIPDDMRVKAKELHDHPGFLIAGRETNSQEFVVLSRVYFNEVMALLAEVGE